MKDNSEPIPRQIREYMSRIARRQLETMTAEQRSERARRAVNARWKKQNNRSQASEVRSQKKGRR